MEARACSATAVDAVSFARVIDCVPNPCSVDWIGPPLSCRWIALLLSSMCVLFLRSKEKGSVAGFCYRVLADDLRRHTKLARHRFPVGLALVLAALPHRAPVGTLDARVFADCFT